MKKLNFIFTAIFSTVFTIQALQASASSSAGTTLLESPSARASGLGDAFTAVTNDISALSFNPAMLSSLDNGQANFLFQKGVFEDSYGQIMVGSPLSKGGIGVSVSYYNGGDLPILENGQEKTVTAQKDMNVSIGTSLKLAGASFGITGKYITSELAEIAKASAFALDFGIGMPVTSRLNFGAAIQNLGSKMTYIEEGEDLPRKLSAGMTYALKPGKMATSFMVDGAYFMNEKELRPSAGIETWVGPLALRAGYKAGSDLQNFTFGTGFVLGPSSIDYSFGLVDKLDSRHMISLAFNFGGASMAPLVKRPESVPFERRVVALDEKKVEKPARDMAENLTQEKEAAPKSVEEVQRKHTLGSVSKSSGFRSTNRRVYTVQRGDSLALIAKKMYGNTSMWRQIYMANKHLLDDPTDLTVGQKISLP